MAARKPARRKKAGKPERLKARKPATRKSKAALPPPAPPAPPKRRPGRPPFVPTDQDRRTVMTQTAGGIEQDLTVWCLSARMSLPTYRKVFRTELRTAKPLADGAVVASLHQMATGRAASPGRAALAPNVLAAIHWTKCRMGWTERTTNLNINADIDPGTLSDADIAERIGKLRRATAAERTAAPKGVPA
jgi:hypothetical protein